MSLDLRSASPAKPAGYKVIGLRVNWSERIVTGVAVSVHTWRRGADALTLAPVTAACAFGVLIAYGVIAPAENTQRSGLLRAIRPA